MHNATVRSWSIAATMACAMGAFAAHGDETQAVQAIWKSQEIQFYYQKTGANFSCDGFQRKVKRVLKELGAVDAEMRVTPDDCGTANQPLVSITMRAPVEATPEAVAATANEQPFAAAWKPLSISRGRMGLETSDCGLVDHLKQLVLPKLAVRIVDDGLDCYSGTVSSAQPKLKVEALVATQ